ncbi:MAG: DUF454 domain-containing protein [Oligoflexia bacterium]|nr:DUF454 domain-containing protein [Oligoflexia bacterium]
MIDRSKKTLFFILAWVSITLGVLGVFLPILPTTPFAILSAYLFSKSSDKYHQWLLNQKLFGPMIRQWEEHGVISLRAKILATVMMTLLFGYTLIFVPVNIVIKCIVSAIGIAVMWFIWSRPHEK